MYEIRYVDENRQAHEEFTRLGAQGVPAFVIGDQVVVGFDRQRIEHLLDYQVVQCPACQARMRVPKGKGKIKVTCSHCRHQFIRNT